MFRGHEEATERAPDAKILSSISGAHTLVQAWYLGHMASQNPSFRSLALWQARAKSQGMGLCTLAATSGWPVDQPQA